MKRLLNILQQIKAFFIRIVIVRLIQVMLAFAFSITAHYMNLLMHQSPFVDGFITGGIFLFIITEFEQQIPKKNGTSK